MRSAWVPLVALAVGALCACGTPQPPEGRLRCERDSDCPQAWVCRDNGHAAKRCYRHAAPLDDSGVTETMDASSSTADGGHDSGTTRMDASTIKDAGHKSDAGPKPDAMSPPSDAGSKTDAGADAGSDTGTPEPDTDAGCGPSNSASCPMLDPPRAIAPVSSGYVTSNRPLFRFVLAAGSDGARVEICEDRACNTITTHFDLIGTSGTPPSALPSRVLYFRLYSLLTGGLSSGPSPVWEFVVGKINAAVKSSYGTLLDIDGDGLAELGVGAPDAVAAIDSMSVTLGPGRAYLYLGDKDAKTSWKTTQPTPRIVLSDPDATNGDLFGSQVVSAGDLDGDGFADLAVSAPCAKKTSSGCGPGKVYVYRGGAHGLFATPAAPETTLSAPANGSDFGVAVAAGDFDGDGYSDLAIGANVADAVYIFRGGADFFAASTATPAWTLSGPSSFGTSVACVGDVNGDSFADLVIGSPTDGGNTIGVAYRVYGGSANGFSPGHMPAKTQFAPTTGSATNANFGAAVAGAFDVNGDGYSDVVIGMPGGDTATGGGTPILDGLAFLYLGGAGGIDTANPSVLSTSAMYGAEGFGRALGGGGDVDGDGHDELVVSAPGFTSTPTTSAVGRALFMSGPTPATGTALNLSEGSKASLFGTSIKAAGDLNGDGYADVVIGTPNYTGSNSYMTPGYYRGKLSIWFGSASSIATAADVTIDGPDGTGGRFGY